MFWFFSYLHLSFPNFCDLKNEAVILKVKGLWLPMWSGNCVNCAIFQPICKTLRKIFITSIKSFYDLLSVFISALVLKFSAHAVSPAVLSLLCPNWTNCHSQQWSFCWQKGWGTVSEPLERSGLQWHFYGLWHFMTVSHIAWVLQMCADVYFAFLHIFYGNLTGLQWVRQWDCFCLGDILYLSANPSAWGSRDFPWLRS